MLNAVERTQGRRVFWVFIAAGYGLWALDQWIYVYYSYNSGSNFIDRDRAFAFSQHFQGAPLDDLPGSANIGALKVFARRTCGNKNQ